MPPFDFAQASDELKNFLKTLGIEQLPENKTSREKIYKENFEKLAENIGLCLELAIFCLTNEEEQYALFKTFLEKDRLLNIAYQSQEKKPFLARILIQYYIKNHPEIIRDEIKQAIKDINYHGSHLLTDTEWGSSTIKAEEKIRKSIKNQRYNDLQLIFSTATELAPNENKFLEILKETLKEDYRKYHFLQIAYDTAKAHSNLSKLIISYINKIDPALVSNVLIAEVRECNVEKIRLLADASANVFIKDTSGLERSLIHVAASSYKAEKIIETIALLLTLGININLKDKNGITALDYAVARYNFCTNNLISIEQKTSTSEQDINNIKLLNNTQRAMLSITKFLLDNGADPLTPSLILDSQGKLIPKAVGELLIAAMKQNYKIFANTSANHQLSKQQIRTILAHSRKFEGYNSDLNNCHIGSYESKLSHAFLAELNPAALVSLTTIPAIKTEAERVAKNKDIHHNNNEGLRVDTNGPDISISVTHPTLKLGVNGEVDRQQLHGNATFTISRQEVQKLLDSHEIYLNPQLPVSFFQQLCKLNEENDFFFSKQENQNVPLSSFTEPLIQALLNEIKLNPQAHGFKDTRHANHIISQSPQQLGTYIVTSQQAYLFVGDGNIIQERPAKPLYIISSTGIDFLTSNAERQRYFKFNKHSRQATGFISSITENNFTARVRQLAADRLVAYQYLGIDIVSELATGLGEFLPSNKFSNDFKKQIQKIYLREMLKLLENNDYGFKAFFYNAGPAKQALEEVLEERRWHFKCPLIVHEKDSYSIAQHAQQLLGADSKIAINNASDPQVLWGKDGKHFEKIGSGKGGKYAAEEHLVSISTKILSHAWLSKAYKGPNRVHNLVLLRETALTLITAVSTNNYSLAVNILSKEKNLFNLKINSYSLLNWAIIKGYSEIAELLIDNGHPVDQLDANNSLPVILAVKHNRASIVRKLIEKGVTIDGKTIPGLTFSLIEWAIINGYTEVAKLLIDAVKTLDKEWLFLAIKKGNLEVVTKLIEKGIDINSIDANNNSAIELALAKRENQIAKLLLEKGGRLHSAEKDLTALQITLMQAIESGEAERVATLIAAGVNINFIDAARNITPLNLAISKGYVQIAKLLIAGGANLEVTEENNCNYPPLLQAINFNMSSVVEIIVREGISSNTLTGITGSPLEYVIRSKESVISQFTNQKIFETGYKEISKEQAKIVELLLKAGADIKAIENIKDSDKQKYPYHATLFKIVKKTQQLISNIERVIESLQSEQLAINSAEIKRNNQFSPAGNSHQFWSSPNLSSAASGIRKFIDKSSKTFNSVVDQALGINISTDINNLESFKEELANQISILCENIGSEENLSAAMGKGSFMIITNAYQSLSKNGTPSIKSTAFYEKYKEAEAQALGMEPPSSPAYVPVLGF